MMNTKKTSGSLLLRARGISKVYDENVVFEDASLDVHAGESISITSPSGGGKSTLLSVLGFLLEPDKGKIEINGKDYTHVGDNERSRARNEVFGFLFQHTQLIGSLRAIENAAVPARFSKNITFDVDKRSKELLVEFGLEDRLFYYPFQLSVGQKRRVAAARAVLLEPPILIADEPTNDLDEDSCTRVLDRLFSMVDKGHALILATHDKKLAACTDHHYEIADKRLKKVC